MCLKTHNVKFHFKSNIRDLSYKTKNYIKSTHKNFIVLRIDEKVFTIFNSGHINVTGVKCFNDVYNTVRMFCNHFLECDYEYCKKSITVDNSTCSAYIDVKKKLYLPDLIKVTKRTVSLRPDFFPGAVLREKNQPTVVVFSTGKFIIIGGKSYSEVNELYQQICQLLATL